MGLELAGQLPMVLGDSDQLMQVCLNLCINALQATPEKGRVTVATREAFHDGERWCEIAVADCGPGIPAEIRESIFDPVFTTKDKGSGLGLAICHQIVVEAGGFMVVDTVEGKGSTFRVNLPAARISEDGNRELDGETVTVMNAARR